MRAFFKFIFICALVIAVIAAILRVLVFQVVKTGSNSMLPTIAAGDWVAIYTGGTLSHGDIAVCRHPKDQSRMIMLRIIGLPDDTVSMRDNHLVVNKNMIQHESEGVFSYYDQSDKGEPYEYELTRQREEYHGAFYFVGTREASHRANFPAVDVESGLFLLGDNRNLAEDSRDFGEVDPSTCIGWAFMILWPGPPNGGVLPSERRFDFLF